MSQDDALPGMSRDQSLILLGQALTPEAPTYSTPVELHVAGRIDPVRLQRAFDAVIANAPILQSRFRLPTGLQPDRATETRIEVMDSGPPEAIEAELRRRRARLLDLSSRAWDSVIGLVRDRSIWLLNVHQIIADQRSVFEIVAGTSTAYAEGPAGTTPLPAGAPANVLAGPRRETARSEHFWQEWSAREFVPGQATSARLDARSATYAVALVGERNARLHRIAQERWSLPGQARLLATVIAVVAEWHRRACPAMEWLCLGLPWHNRSAGQERMIGPLMRVTPLQLPVREPAGVIAAAIQRGIIQGLAYRHYSPSNPPYRPLYDCLLNLSADTAMTSFAGMPAKLFIKSSGSSIERLNIQVETESRGTEVLIKQRMDDQVPRLSDQLIDEVLLALDSPASGMQA